MSRARKAAATIVILVVVLLLLPPFAIAGEDFAPDRMAWRLTIKPEKFDGYLDFPKSKINSITRIAVYHEDLGQGKDSKPVLYKNFYFEGTKPVGSKQFKAVTFPRQTRGPIMVQPGTTTPDAETSAAAANVAVRLFLQLYTSKNFPQFIVVDDNMFPDFIEGTKKVGFVPFTLPLSRNLRPKPKAIMVLKSERNDKFQYMMYQ